MNAILSVRDLTKNFGSVEAVRGISFDIPEGICFGFLGPNGAGKTTSIEIMEGIQNPTSGSVLFRGESIHKMASYKEKIGIQFQTSALPEFITVKETLELFASFYKHSRPLDEVIELCSLQDIIKRDNRKLSGGQRQRMLLGLAIISRPELIFLDEPTTGLDPQSRRNFWDLIGRIKKEDCTVLLTTHYMDEAEILCDQIAIIDQGRIIEIDTPENLLDNHFEGLVIELPWSDTFTKDHAKGLMNMDGVKLGDEGIEITTNQLDSTMKSLLGSNIVVDNLRIHKPNLEDLFIKLTGSSLRA